MGAPKGNVPVGAAVSEPEFLRIWREENGNIRRIAARIGVSERSVQYRRRNVEEKHGEPLHSEKTKISMVIAHHKARVNLTIDDGCVVVFGDAHFRPGHKSVAFQALLKTLKRLKNVRGVIANGDIPDFSQISKHPRIGWEHRPTIKQEMEGVRDRLDDIIKAAGPGVWKIWNLGNHCARWELNLAARVPEYEGMHGFSLKDWFPEWTPSWSTHINAGTDDWTEIKHRWKSGKHAPFNNAKEAAVHYVTGHLHSQKVQPFTNRRGTVYGVDAGCLADVDDYAFINYTEDAPLDWRSGFVVLTYRGGVLMPPELCTVTKLGAVFRGEVIQRHE